MAKALISCKVHPVLLEKFDSAGVKYDYQPGISYEEVKEVIGNYHILIISTSIAIDKDLLSKANHLNIIGRIGSGMEHIDQEEVQKKSIELLRSPMGNARSVAEHILAMMLNYSKNIGASIQEVREGKWIREGNRGFELQNMTIGIIGFGSNGSETGKLLKAIGMQVKVYDKYKTIDANTWDVADSPEQLIEDVDFLSFHVPYKQETHHYFNENLLAHAQKPIYLINMSRGEVVDTEILLEGLENQKIEAAFLDVIEEEKSQIKNSKIFPNKINDQLIHHPKVYLTPHIAGYSQESLYKMSEILGQKVIKALCKSQ